MLELKDQSKTDTNPVDTENGDHDLYSHYVTKTALEKAILDGIPTVALCGKKWLPTKDPERFSVCPECKDKWKALNDA